MTLAQPVDKEIKSPWSASLVSFLRIKHSWVMSKISVEILSESVL